MPRPLLVAMGLCLVCAASATASAPDGAVIFLGNPGLRPSEVRKALRDLKSTTILPGIPGIWKGWHLVPDYNPQAVQAGASALQSLYYRRGYFDARVEADPVAIDGGRARIRYTVSSGPHYAIARFDGQMNHASSSGEIPLASVCRELLQERRNAEKTGVLDFSARLELQDAPAPSAAASGQWVDAVANLHSGPAYRAARIDFHGNHQFRDPTLRRMLLIDEGAPLDSLRLRRSLSRLNRTGWFEPLTASNVEVATTPNSDRARVTIHLQETKPRRWSLSGPVGPMSIGGSLRFSLGARLPPWGRGLFEMSTYTVSANLMLLAKPLGAVMPFLPNRRFLWPVSIERPMLAGQPWLSGFAITPQYGWPAILAGYGVSQARNLLRRVSDTSSAYTPPLSVTFAHGSREGTISCVPPQTRLDRARKIGALAGNSLLSIAPF